MKNVVKVVAAQDGTKSVEITSKVKVITLTCFNKHSKTLDVKEYRVKGDMATIAIDQIKKSLVSTGYKIVDVEKRSEFDVQSYPLNYLLMLANECDRDGAIYSKYMRELTTDTDTDTDAKKDGE